MYWHRAEHFSHMISFNAPSNPEVDLSILEPRKICSDHSCKVMEPMFKYREAGYQGLYFLPFPKTVSDRII